MKIKILNVKEIDIAVTNKHTIGRIDLFGVVSRSSDSIFYLNNGFFRNRYNSKYPLAGNIYELNNYGINDIYYIETALNKRDLHYFMYLEDYNRIFKDKKDEK